MEVPVEYRELASRMSRAFKEVGFFLFEGDELEGVSKILKGAGLKETLKVVPLGDVKIELASEVLETSYYVVIIDYQDCIRDCEDSECIEKCVEEKKQNVSEAVLEGLEGIKEESKSLDEVYKKLIDAGGGI